MVKTTSRWKDAEMTYRHVVRSWALSLQYYQWPSKNLDPQKWLQGVSSKQSELFIAEYNTVKEFGQDEITTYKKNGGTGGTSKTLTLWLIATP